VNKSLLHHSTFVTNVFFNTHIKFSASTFFTNHSSISKGKANSFNFFSTFFDGLACINADSANTSTTLSICLFRLKFIVSPSSHGMAHSRYCKPLVLHIFHMSLVLCHIRDMLFLRSCSTPKLNNTSGYIILYLFLE
jgi:hypothetical protein